MNEVDLGWVWWCNMDLEDEELVERLQGLIAVPEAAERARHLALELNRLTFLPPEVSHLERVTCLYAGSNKITYISPLIGQMTWLKELHMGSNQLSTLPASLKKLKELKW